MEEKEKEKERDRCCKGGEENLLPLPTAHVQGKKMVYNIIKTTSFSSASFIFNNNKQNDVVLHKTCRFIKWNDT